MQLVGVIWELLKLYYSVSKKQSFIKNRNFLHKNVLKILNGFNIASLNLVIEYYGRIPYIFEYNIKI